MSTIQTNFEDGVLTATLDRPEKQNAMNRTMIEDLVDLFESAEEREGLRCLVLRGSDGVFCAGGDREMLDGRLDEMSADEYRQSLKTGAQRMIRVLYHLPVPTVACVEGAAVGGGANLAFACDLVLAAEETTFGEVFRHVGLVADTGGSYLVPKDVGLHRAKELFYTGRTFDASTAEEFGLINYAVPKEEFEDRCTALIEEVATGPTRSLAILKQLLHDAVDSDLETMLAAEADAQAIAYETEDHRRGVQALLDGVEPSFRGE